MNVEICPSVVPCVPAGVLIMIAYLRVQAAAMYHAEEEARELKHAIQMFEEFSIIQHLKHTTKSTN